MNKEEILDILKEIYETYGDVLEYAGHGRPYLYEIITAKMIAEQRKQIDNLKKRLELYEYKTAV